jgi:hypothetical protein
MVGKELWSRLLAYNLIRVVMAQAAFRHKLESRQLSFKAAVQTLAAFALHVVVARGKELSTLLKQIAEAMAYHQVGDRPDRYEPRARKRRYDNFKQLRRPRAEAKALLPKGICEEFM